MIIYTISGVLDVSVKNRCGAYYFPYDITNAEYGAYSGSAVPLVTTYRSKK